jgi:tyrosinase
MKATPLGVWANATSIWDEITWVHDQLSDRIHGVDSFLPWHRYYLHMLQTLLKEQCAYTGPMPWWRETKYTGNFAGSGLFTPEYFGALPPLSNTGEGTCITDGVSNTTISSSFLQDFQVTTIISNTL